MREHGFNDEVNCSFVAASEQWMCFSNMFVIIIPVWNLRLMTPLKFHSHAKTMTQLFLSVSIDLQLWNRRLIIYMQEKANRTHATWWFHDQFHERLMVRGKCTVLGRRQPGRIFPGQLEGAAGAAVASCLLSPWGTNAVLLISDGASVL